MGQETQSQDMNISALRSLMRKTITNMKEVLICDGNEMLSNRLRHNITLQFEIHMVTSLMAVCDVPRGTLGPGWVRPFLAEKQRAQTQIF